MVVVLEVGRLVVVRAGVVLAALLAGPAVLISCIVRARRPRGRSRRSELQRGNSR